MKQWLREGRRRRKPRWDRAVKGGRGEDGDRSSKKKKKIE